MDAQSNTPPAPGDARLPGSASGKGHLRATLRRFLIQPIFSRLRDYLLGPVHTKFDLHATESRDAIGRIQLQMQVIRADLDVLPKQLVQFEFRYRNLAKQIDHLASQLAVLADQLKQLESRGGSVHERNELLVDSDSSHKP